LANHIEPHVDPEELVEAFDHAYQTDDESFDKKGSQMIYLYEHASDDEKNVIDNLLTTLCGWTMKSLCERSNTSKE
jgi:hypothetical protein